MGETVLATVVTVRRRLGGLQKIPREKKALCRFILIVKTDCRVPDTVNDIASGVLYLPFHRSSRTVGSTRHGC